MGLWLILFAERWFLKIFNSIFRIFTEIRNCHANRKACYAIDCGKITALRRRIGPIYDKWPRLHEWGQLLPPSRWPEPHMPLEENESGTTRA